jgi:hypothetical protein
VGHFESLVRFTAIHARNWRLYPATWDHEATVSDYEPEETERLGPADRFMSPLPASGALKPGDPTGRRKFVTITDERSFGLEGGGSLPEVQVAYETWGELDETAGNAILVCHALTGESHAEGVARTVAKTPFINAPAVP